MSLKAIKEMNRWVKNLKRRQQWMNVHDYVLNLHRWTMGRIKLRALNSELSVSGHGYLREVPSVPCCASSREHWLLNRSYWWSGTLWISSWNEWWNKWRNRYKRCNSSTQVNIWRFWGWLSVVIRFADWVCAFTFGHERGCQAFTALTCVAHPIARRYLGKVRLLNPCTFI